MRRMLCVLLLGVTQLSFALTCPSAGDIHRNKLAGWKGYDIYGKAFTQQQVANFKNHSLEFVMAEVKAHEGAGLSIRCLYKDKNGANLQGFLSSEHMMADNLNYWYKVSGSQHCAAGLALCKFHHILTNSQLAFGNGGVN